MAGLCKWKEYVELAATFKAMDCQWIIITSFQQRQHNAMAGLDKYKNNS